MAYELKEFVGNAAQTTLTAGISDSATTITIDDATNWPTGGANGAFIIAIGLGTPTEEKILCTDRTGTTLTVRASTGRGHDGTTAQAHSLGATVDHVLDAETVQQISRLANLMTTKGDIIASNGTNPVRVAKTATDGHVLQVKASEATGLVFDRPIALVVDPSAPAVAGTPRIWYDESLKILRPSDGSSWLLPTQLPSVDDATDRDSTFPSPAKGQCVFRDDLDFAEFYDGSKWVPVGNPKFSSISARDTYFATPAEGDEAYITASNQKHLYRNGEWIRIGGKVVVSATLPTLNDGDTWYQPVD